MFRKRIFWPSERGATMVEFSVVAVLFFALLGLIFDIGIALHRYMLLTQFAGDSAHKIAIAFTEIGPSSYTSGLSCDSYQGFITSDPTYGINLKQEVYKNYDTRGNFTLTPKFSRSGNGSYHQVSVDAIWPYDCIFCVLFPGKNIKLKVSSEAIIEDRAFSCT